MEEEELESLTGERRQPSPAAAPNRGVHRWAVLLLLLLFLVTCAAVVVFRLGGGPVDVNDKQQQQQNTTTSNDEAASSGVVSYTSHPVVVDDKQQNTANNDDLVQIKAARGSGFVYNVTKQAAQHIDHYRQGTGLIVNVHITHHGGTTFCGTIGRSPDAIGDSPSFACLQPRDENFTDFPKGPWSHNATTTNIARVRKRFHMVSWEFGSSGGHLPKPPLKVTDWENPNLLSVIVMRDPISRLLAGNAWKEKHFPDIKRGNATEQDWWGYAKDPWRTNNYALRVLAGKECCNGTHTERKYLEHAKELVERFSIVLDMECLSDGLEALANVLNITLAGKGKLRKPRYHHAPSRERIGHDDVYKFLLNKNRLDIELYEWSKNLALVNCSKIKR